MEAFSLFDSCLRCTLAIYQIHLPSPSLALDQRRKHNNLDTNLLAQTRLLKVARHDVLGFAGRCILSSLVERQLELSPTTAATHALVSLGRTLR
ncbi:MAG: hypothetical protein HOO90_07600 [Methylotenera sp.]|uniref:hypothetical protein n=1 Tax=Methylotenera sp. TaxID=2051956 RepID=UPI0017999CC3|nr:hypothetical protein [Methylotenera sp.]NOU25385.1 hypothetical protein [Methylotenera sp.]